MGYPGIPPIEPTILVWMSFIIVTRNSLTALQSNSSCRLKFLMGIAQLKGHPQFEHNVPVQVRTGCFGGALGG